MALTEDQKTQVRYFLGYSETSVISSSPLESAWDVINNRASALTMIGTLLTRLTAIDAALISGGPSKAGLKRAEDVEFYQGGALMEQRSEGSRLCYALARLVGVPVVATPFDDGPSSGLVALG